MKKSFKSLLSILLSVLLIFSTFVGCAVDTDTDIDVTITQTTEQTTHPDMPYVSDDLQIESFDEPYDPNRPVVVPDEAEDLKAETSEEIKSGEDIASVEIPEDAIIPEADVTDEGVMEADGTVELENIAYNGTTNNAGAGINLLSPYVGRTYYSQLDADWKNLPYTSCNNKSQTIGSSGCGPTCAAMIVTSMIGTIKPPMMCTVSASNGYRTKDNGTAWAFWPFIADYFSFDDYQPIYNWSDLIKYLNIDKNGDGIGDYMIVVSCGPGLFTSSGHYIVIYKADVKSTKINTLDPYYYLYKYSTVSRAGAGLVMSGNIGTITESKFKSYSNWKQAWAYYGTPKKTTQPETKKDKNKIELTSVKYTRYVATSNKSSTLNIRSGPGTNYSIVKSLKYGDKIVVIGITKDGRWAKIADKQFVNTSYLSSSPVISKTVVKTTDKPKTSKSPEYLTVLNKTYKLKSNTTLYSKGTLSGTKYEYKAGTTVKIIKHYNTKVDYIYVEATGRYAYVEASKLVVKESKKTQSVKSTVGQHKRLAKDTTLYYKSNLTGAEYHYYANTEVIILENISAKIDKVKVVKTGRVAHVSSNSYK